VIALNHDWTVGTDPAAFVAAATSVFAFPLADFSRDA
jgi:hypothetical protein